MTSKHILAAIFFLVLCASIGAISKGQNADPHKAIDDYLKAFERLVEKVEELDPDEEQNFALLAENSENFNATAQSLKTNEEWTKNDSAMLKILNERYSNAVSRLVSGNIANGHTVTF